MKNGGYAFGDEFEDLTIATFDSTRTAKYSGYGTITIQLVDAEENLINSANVVCKIIESNSQTPFVVSPDFAQESKREIQAIVDEGKGEIAIATKEAKEKIDSWTDQSSRIAKNESDISDLQMFKANTGALHFNGGNAQCSGLANKPIPNVNTIAFRWKCDSITFENIPVNQRVVGYVSSWYHLARISGGLQFYVKYADGPQFIGLTESNIISLLTDGNWHNVAIISTGTTFDFAIDGKILKSVKRTKTTDFAIPTTNFIVSYSTTNIGSIADVFIFNFDMSSADAPYTIEDYQQGKPIPPKALEYTILALENYTITNGNSKIVFDYSGNNNDATITGDVKGDNDNRVQKLVDFITTLS